MKADPYQISAIEFGTGPALISAGPGSGKTFVLTRRIQNLITRQGVSPDRILVLTFSKEAAIEMKARFLSLMKDNHTNVTFGTFHAVFLHILKANCIYNLSVLSDSEKLILMQTVLNQNGIRQTFAPFAASLLEEVQKFKSSDMPIAEYKSNYLQPGVFRLIVQEYERMKDENEKLDFDDILIKTRELFVMHPEILWKLQKKYKYILVDEFQDINPIQYEIVSMIADGSRNLYVVGDDDQSIYSFRGANPSVMQMFLLDYPDAVHINLSNNYRSGREILCISGNLIRHNKNRLVKDVFPCVEQAGEVELKCFRNIEQQYGHMAIQLKKLPYKELGDTSILIRTNNVPEELIHILDESKVPFYIRRDCARDKNSSEQESDNSAESAKTDYVKKGVVIMTMHASKGLEFKNVWIPDLTEGNIPYVLAKDDNALEEERRMLYVAMTRAGYTLHLYTVKKTERRKTERLKPSRFMKDLRS